MSYTVVRKNKTYNKRILKIYSDKKLISAAVPCMGWFGWTHGFSNETDRICCRREVLKNLYWLLGQDCDKETWIKRVDKWDNGRGISNVPANCKSLFFNDDDRLTAIESFDNI